ncbi:MAG: DUF92 domain-containing protein [Halorubrum sp.]
MNRRLKRAGVFAGVGALAVVAPALGDAAAVPFLAIAGAVLFGIRDGPWFEILALPGDREAERLYGLGAFALALAGLAAFATLPRVPLPFGAFVAAALAVGGGRLGYALFDRRFDGEFKLVGGYLVVGALAALVGQAVVAAVAGEFPVPDPLVAADALLVSLPVFTFLAAVAALMAALVRSFVYDRDEHITVVVVAFVVWGFLALEPTVSALGIVAGLAVTVALGYVSYALGAASVPGMLTGVLLALLTVVLGGVGWFLTLMMFYSVGALASKYRFDEKAERGVAQENQGARGTGNVLANSAVALVALIGYAATDHVGVTPALFGFAFAGAIGTAMADTLSSEIGGLFDGPRLITTLERVEPGTDGAVTWQGELAGGVGAVLVAAVAAVGIPLGDPVGGGAVVFVAGVVGMTVDSLLGVLIEGERVGNQSVNFLATLAGAFVAVGGGLLL